MKTTLAAIAFAALLACTAYLFGYERAKRSIHADIATGRWVIFNARYPQFKNGSGNVDVTRVVILDSATGRTYTYDESVTLDASGNQTEFRALWRPMDFSRAASFEPPASQ